MIELTKSTVEQEFTQEKMRTVYGIESKADTRIIYGDTDSVMIRFFIDDIGQALELGKKAAAIVNSHFIPPINLILEKVHWVAGR